VQLATSCGVVIHRIVKVIHLRFVAFQEESRGVAEGLSGDGDLVFHMVYIAFWLLFRQGLFFGCCHRIDSD